MHPKLSSQAFPSRVEGSNLRSKSPTLPGALIVGHHVVEEPNLGVRKTMEDFTIVEEDLLKDGRFSVYIVLDGHGGDEVVKLVKVQYPEIVKKVFPKHKGESNMKSAISESLKILDEKILKSELRDCGTTFCGLFIDRVSKACVAVNIGDSRLLRGLPATFITSEHKVSNETEVKRIKKMGGEIFNGRVAGTLLVTRSLGDIEMRPYGLSSEPELISFNAKPGIYAIASDGIWDNIDTKTFDEIATKFAGKSLDKLSNALVTTAIDKGSMDNISLILIVMK